MIKRFIANIRRRPKAVRETIAFWIAAGFTGLVLLVWLYHLPSRFDNADLTLKQREDDSSFFDGFRNQLSATREAVSEKNASNEEEQVLDGMIQTFRERRGTSSSSTPQTSASSTATSFSSPEEPSPKPQAIRISTTSEASASSSQQTQ